MLGGPVPRAAGRARELTRELRHTVVGDGAKTARITTNTTTDLTARQALDQWLTMWNGDGDLARSLCADDFRIHFAVTEPDGSTPADDIRSAEDFARYLQWWHGQHPGVVFTSVADAVDGHHGRLLWDMQAGDLLVGGVDVFDFAADGRVRRVWSVGGQRSMRS